MTLDEIADSLPWGFHDAHLHGVDVDWTGRRATLHVSFKLDEHQKFERRARVVVEPMHWAFVAPALIPSKSAECEGRPLWIDAMALEPEAAAKLPPIPDGAFATAIYDRDTFTYVYVCGRDARLEWLDAEATASGERAYFAGDEIPEKE